MAVRVYNTIRFVDGFGQELFRIPDGGSIRIIYPDDIGRGSATSVCTYIDETHVEIGGTVYHIGQLAESTENTGVHYEPAAQLSWLDISPYNPVDEKYYTYNRELGNLCIGHISGDFGQNGDRFDYYWKGRENGKNTPKFQTDLHCAMYALRKNVLKDYASMVDYCQSFPAAKILATNTLNRYGFKLDAGKREYFVVCKVAQDGRHSSFIVYAYNKAVNKRTGVML